MAIVSKNRSYSKRRTVKSLLVSMVKTVAGISGVDGELGGAGGGGVGRDGLDGGLVVVLEVDSGDAGGGVAGGSIARGEGSESSPFRSS